MEDYVRGVIAAIEKDPALGAELSVALERARATAPVEPARVEAMVQTPSDTPRGWRRLEDVEVERAARRWEPVVVATSGHVIRTRAEAQTFLRAWQRPDGSVPEAFEPIREAVEATA